MPPFSNSVSVLSTAGLAASNNDLRTSGVSWMSSMRLLSFASLNAACSQSSKIFAALSASALPVSLSNDALCVGVRVALLSWFMMATQGLCRLVQPSVTYLASSLMRQVGISAVGVSATMSTTPVESALYMSLRSIGTGEAPHAATIGANAAPGVITFMPLRSAMVRTGLSREISVACGTEYMWMFRTSL